MYLNFKFLIKYIKNLMSYETPVENSSDAYPETIDELNTFTDDNVDLFSFNGETHLAKVVKCYDGDTIHCIFKHNQKYSKFHIRMYGYDSPEMKPSTLIDEKTRNEIKDAAIKAKQKLEELILFKIVILECLNFDKYGRLLANVKLTKNDKKTINQIMIECGFSKEYYGGTK